MVKITRVKISIDKNKVYRFKIHNQNTEIEFDTSLANFSHNFTNAYLEARLKDKNNDLFLALYNGSDWNIMKNEKGADTTFSKIYKPGPGLSISGEAIIHLYEHKKKRGQK